MKTKSNPGSRVLTNLLVAILVFPACSTDSIASDDNCLYPVIGTSESCVDNSCRYSLSYGPNTCNYLVQETDEATYNFYQKELGAETRCWEGEAPDLDLYPYRNGDDDCKYKVSFLGGGRCDFLVGYGPDRYNYKVIPTNEATYNFYKENMKFGSDCWEGEK